MRSPYTSYSVYLRGIIITTLLKLVVPCTHVAAAEMLADLLTDLVPQINTDIPVAHVLSID